MESISNQPTPRDSNATSPDNLSTADTLSEQDEGTMTPPSKQTTPATSPHSSFRYNTKHLSCTSDGLIPDPIYPLPPVFFSKPYNVSGLNGVILPFILACNKAVFWHFPQRKKSNWELACVFFVRNCRVRGENCIATAQLNWNSSFIFPPDFVQDTTELHKSDWCVWRRSKWSWAFRFVEETFVASLWKVWTRTALPSVPTACCLETSY